ncbi:YsnF/AvaK domain-containing protein [Hymenobacter crusticola]|uniref:DUF2382 domain-containing protein n=1 Tax=Hymenobacter crusticola TaxID=1770526 RepID=A0A243WK70_9BACT|nr:YsnF/AvaK domain-containing protein [Hymenobacter crusticola]OUJ75747.1 hypothetical protein BXP70_00090 [Hymenobacter crusticola]
MSATQDLSQQAVPDPQRISPTVPDQVTIPVIEEYLQIGREVVETGRVRITKSVTQTPEAAVIPLVHEEVSVERVACNQYVDVAPAMRQEGEVTIIPVVREVIVKRLLVVEELHITKRRVETLETQQIVLRKEEVHVERITPDNAPAAPVAPTTP